MDGYSTNGNFAFSPLWYESFDAQQKATILRQFVQTMGPSIDMMRDVRPAPFAVPSWEPQDSFHIWNIEILRKNVMRTLYIIEKEPSES